MAGCTAADAKTPLKLKKVVLTEDQLNLATEAMDKFIATIQDHPDQREDATPYYLLHKQGEYVYGTVLMFHGFSATTGQMALLAQYLFENGFNVYQPALCGHYFNKPAKYWPLVHMKPSLKEMVQEKLMADPQFSAIINNFKSVVQLTTEEVLCTPLLFFFPTPIVAAEVHCGHGMLEKLDHEKNLLITEEFCREINVTRERVSLDYPELDQAINDDNFTKAFYTWFESQHLDYLHEAEARLQEVHALPGPVFTVGLSMGGAVSLALAALHPDKIAKTAIFSPLLKVKDQKIREFCQLAGQFGAHECWWYPEMPFPLSCFVAVDVFSRFVCSKNLIDVLAKKIPTLAVFTEIDDVADVTIGQKFFADLCSIAGNEGPPHLSSTYTTAEKVPHPMVNPTEVSQCTTNRYWNTLYQETFRFLTQGTIVAENLHKLSQDPDLPQVHPL